MTRERVEQAIERLRYYVETSVPTWIHDDQVEPDEALEALTTLSNALAESHPNDACRNFWKLVATTAEARLAESEKERERLLDALERLGIYVNKYPSIPDLAAQVSKQLRQALSTPETGEGS